MPSSLTNGLKQFETKKTGREAPFLDSTDANQML